MNIISNLLETKCSLKVEIVDVPELGDGAQIMLQEFTAEAASDFNYQIVKSKKVDSTTAADNSYRGSLLFYSMLICCAAVNEKGERIASAKDAEALLSKWDDNLILKVGAVASSLNGFTKDAKEEVKKDSPANQPQQ